MGEAEEYDVFINHRGPDTKNNVASLIHRRLEGYGVRAFLDETELEAEDLCNTVKSAISSSSVYIAIFSVRYAESSWCLNELLEMMQSRCKIIPIFYDIKPSYLRDIEKGHYAEAFLRHSDRYAVELVERWKDALQKASLISGTEFNTNEHDLGYLVEETVEEVLKEAKGELLHVAEHPVGLHKAEEDFNHFLEQKQLSGTKVVGIIGPYGSGKSTLARHLYNCYLQSRKFKRYCFLSELNENGLAVLQQQLVRDLLGDDKYSISDTTKGKRKLQTRLKGCGPVLIVLDGLDMEEQIESLLVVKEDDLAEGSLILVTCQYKVLLAGHQVIRFYVKLLQGEDARELFCWYAFGAPKPPKDLGDLVEKFLEICCHFPLALKVLGQTLSVDHDPRYWEEQLEDLVRQESPTNIVDNLFVGLHVAAEEAAEEIRCFYHELSSTTVVGIIGLHGSGKSTLVRHLYNRYLQSRKFKRHCLLSELNENDLAVMQQQLVRDLLGDDKYSITDTTKGRRELQTCLKGCGPVLIVLDGLDKEKQIESLLLVVKENVLAGGSLILVTCHDKALLAGHQVNLFYHVHLLQGEEARNLFCWYAFDAPKPPKHLEDLVEKFLEICCGFPLALKVLGRILYKRDRRYWEAQLKDLSGPELRGKIVDKILKVSYSFLDERKKEVFLDVAHFLVGEDTDLAERVLEGLHDTSGLICLQELQSKCLLDLEETEHCKRPFAKGPGIQWRTKGSSKIRMHDLVRKMARQIAWEDYCSSPATKPLRLRQLDDKSILLQGQSGVCHVRGIRCEDQDIKESQLPRRPWPLTCGLKLLVLHDFRVPLPSDRLSGDLIWLRMHKSNWSSRIPSNLSLRNLRVLELDGVNFEVDRMDGDNFPSKLYELTVDYCGESAKIPERNLASSSRFDKNSMEASSSASGSVWDWFRFRQLKDLVKMVLKDVKGLKSLPIDFEALRNLRHLDLSGWSDLEKMPDSFTGLLQLQYLALQDCESLSISDLGGITKLEYLDFEGCCLLRELPDKTTAQRGLRYLNLMGTRIQELPHDIGNLIKLEQLLINSYLIGLPISVHKLGRLRILSLSGSTRPWDSLESISIEHFPYLERLQLWDVDDLPQGIAWSSVKFLYVNSGLVSEFNFERDQGKLPLDRSHGQGSTDDGATDHNPVSHLTELKLVGTCISSLRISPEGLYPDLEIVDLSDNCELKEVQSLPGNLRKLFITNCPSLTTLPCLYNLPCIRILDISGCNNLEGLNLEGLRSIEEIEVKECWNLQSIQGLVQLHTLSSLNFSPFHEDPNTTIWSEILGLPSNISTVILGGAKVLCKNADEMDSVRQSILEEFEGATIIDIPTLSVSHQVSLSMESYGAILFCFIAKKSSADFEVRVRDNVYHIRRHNGVRNQQIQEEHEAYIFMWSQNSNLFKDLTFHGQSVLDCNIQLHYRPSLTKAWIVMIRNRTDGVKICQLLLNSLLHPQASS